MLRYDTPDEVLAALAAQPYSHRFPLPPGMAGEPLPAVYVLDRGDNVPWYVGQSADVRKRLNSHAIIRSMRENGPVSVKVLPCSNHEEVEKWLIDTLKPTLNRKAFLFLTEAPDMQMEEHKLELLAKLAALETVAGLRRDIAALAAKIRHPMFDILEKVPGDSLAERARHIGVSRQTMYQWINERLRPSPEQAKAIEKLTGVDTHLIRATGEDANDAGRPLGKTHRRMAKASERVPARAGRVRPKRGGVVSKRGARGHVGKVRKRTRKGTSKTTS